MTRLSAFLFAVLLAGEAVASIGSSLSGQVVDGSGRPVAGAVVSVRSPGEYRRTVSDAAGSYRFDALAARTYVVTVAARGFVTSTTQVEVVAGLATIQQLTVTSGLSQTITVMAEEPLLDVGKAVTGTEISLLDLEGMPTTRDPWAILRSTPGVLSDRVNVGGNESVDQALEVNKGTTSDQSVFSIDGTPITDMVDTGLLPTFFDFDSFESISVITGGSDPRIATSGVQMRMTVKRGGDRWHGGGRWLFTNASLQSSSSLSSSESAYLTRPSSIRTISDRGVESGGPLLKEKAWIWAGYADRNYALFPARTDDGYGTSFGDSRFVNADAKLNYQLTGSNDGSVLALYGDHRRQAVGLSPLRAPETSWDEATRSGFVRLEQSALVSRSAILRVSASQGKFSIRRDPLGGTSVDSYYDDSGIVHRSFLFSRSDRPQRHASLSASLFRRAFGADHEVRVGSEWRDLRVDEIVGWPGSGNHAEFDTPVAGVAVLTRPGRPRYRTEYASVYAGDTVTFKRLTVLAGVRFDRQDGGILASGVPANAAFPDLLPAAEFRGTGDRVRWSDVSPRVGLTYAFGSSRQTLLRVAYNRYADQLSARMIGSVHPFYDTQGLLYAWSDLNGDSTIQRNELLGFSSSFNVDRRDPQAAPALRRIESGMKSSSTSEWTAGLERQLGSNVLFSLNVTRRTRQRMPWTIYERTRGAGDFYQRDDYELGGTITGRLPDGVIYGAPWYRLKDRLATAYPVIANRPDYEQQYRGADVTLLKRFSNGWMLRGGLALNDWRQKIGPRGITDPTAILGEFGCSSCDDAVVVQAPDQRLNPKESVFVNARWAFSLSALVRLPRAFTVSATVFARQGYPIPYVRRIYAGDGTGSKDLLVNGVRAGRNDDVFELDARVAKDVTIAGMSLTLSADVFNVTNSRSVLQRSHRLNNLTIFPNPWNRQVLEMQSPRLIRLGARVAF